MKILLKASTVFIWENRNTYLFDVAQFTREIIKSNIALINVYHEEYWTLCRVLRYITIAFAWKRGRSEDVQSHHLIVGHSVIVTTLISFCPLPLI